MASRGPARQGQCPVPGWSGPTWPRQPHRRLRGGEPGPGEQCRFRTRGKKQILSLPDSRCCFGLSPQTACRKSAIQGSLLRCLLLGTSQAGLLHPRWSEDAQNTDSRVDLGKTVGTVPNTVHTPFGCLVCVLFVKKDLAARGPEAQGVAPRPCQEGRGGRAENLPHRASRQESTLFLWVEVQKLS